MWERFCLFLLVVSVGFLSDRLSASQRAEIPKKWTFMFYFASDNDLDSDFTANVREIESIPFRDEVNIAILQDHAGPNNTEKRVKRNGRFVTENVGEINSGDWHEAVKFFESTIKEFPAEHYFFLIGDHGLGWVDWPVKNPRFAPMDVAIDQNDHGIISTVDLGRMTAEMKKLLGRNLDILAFDACLMAMVEVGYEVSRDVDYVVFSEDIVSGRGWPYTKIFSHLYSDPSMGPRSFAEQTVREYIDFYNSGEFGLSKEVIAALDTARFPRFLSAFSDYTQLIRSNMFLADRYRIGFSQARSMNEPSYRDIYDVVKNIKSASHDLGFGTIDRQLLDALNEGPEPLIFASGRSRFTEPGAEGLSIYVPSADEFTKHREAYRKLRFSQETAWDEFLADYFEPAVAVPVIESIKAVPNSSGHFPTPGEDALVEVTLSNASQVAAQDVLVSVETQDPCSSQRVSDAKIGELPGRGKKSVTLKLQVKIECPQLHQIDLNIRVTANTNSITQKADIVVRKIFQKTTDTLLVVDDATTKEAKKYLEALAEAPTPFDLWEQSFNGKIQKDILHQYVNGAVMIACIEPRDTLNLSVRLVDDYLDSGGALFISGRDVAKSKKDSPFLQNYLGADFVNDDANIYKIGGRGPFLDQDFTLTTDGGRPISPDLVSARPGSQLVFGYIRPEGYPEDTGAGVYFDRGSSKVLFLAFGLETVEDPVVRATLIEKGLGLLKH